MSVASLSAGLLARKGAARPSIVNTVEPYPVRSAASPASQSDASQLSAPQRSPASRPNAGEEAPESADAAISGVRSDHHGRVRLSLRLDPDRHRRLRLASVHLEASIQDVLTTALDRYLSSLDVHCPCLEVGRNTCEIPCNETETRR